MRTRNPVPPAAAPPAVAGPFTAGVADGCGPCQGGDHHCHGTLVLHADGSAECDEAHACGAREDLHDWWVACVELDCGCTGDEQHPPILLLAA